MFKKGDKVIIKINSFANKYDDLLYDKILTVKNAKYIDHFKIVWLTFEGINDAEIGNGLPSAAFTLAVNRKSRIENLFEIL